MSAPAIPLKEFDQEMSATRRLLERIPSDRAEWKPHEKSFPLGHLTQLVATFDRLVAEAREALQEVTGARLEEPWQLRMGEQVLFTLPRGEVVRQHLNHFCHHRGQLTVYARLVDVPLPSLYGPTADEKWF